MKTIALVPIIILGLTGISIVLFIPPTNSLVIYTLIVIISLCVFLGVRLRFTKKIASVVAVGVCLFFLNSYVIGFQLVSTLLLILGIIGILILLR